MLPGACQPSDFPSAPKLPGTASPPVALLLEGASLAEGYTPPLGGGAATCRFDDGFPEVLDREAVPAGPAMARQGHGDCASPRKQSLSLPAWSDPPPPDAPTLGT